MEQEIVRPRDANGRFIPFSEPIPVGEPTPVLPNKEYVQQLMANTGVHPSSVDMQLQLHWSALADRNQINKEYFAWMQQRQQGDVQFTEEDLVLFNETLKPQTSGEVAALKREMADRRQNIMRNFRRINDDLSVLSDYRTRLQLLERTEVIKLEDEVKAILADGWYTYNAEKTRVYNTHYSDKAIIFETSTVFMRHYNPEAGVNFQLDMGRFEVQYIPSRSRIVIIPCENNISYEGYTHPHLTSDGDLCWGNATTTYHDCMCEAKPSKAFAALRVILSTYNDDNPFVDIAGFIIASDPHALDDYPAEYLAHSSVTIRDHYLPDGTQIIEDVGEDDDGNELSLVSVYRKYRSGVLISPDLYVKLTTGEYESIDEDCIYEWS